MLFMFTSLDVKKGPEYVCVQVSYLCIAYLQCAGVQLFDPGIMSGHQYAVLPPEDGRGGVTRGHAVEDHCTVHSHRLIGRALSDNRWRAVGHDCGWRRRENEQLCGGMQGAEQWRCSCGVTGTERTEDSDNYIQPVWENTKKAESSANLTNSM